MNSSITAKAVYNGLSSTATVWVNAAASPTVTVSVQAVPASGSAPLTSTITAIVSGTATGILTTHLIAAMERQSLSLERV